jgi:hypothetical protein
VEFEGSLGVLIGLWGCVFARWGDCKRVGSVDQMDGEIVDRTFEG